MKRLSTILLVLAMLISLCACGAKSVSATEAAAPMEAPAVMYDSAAFEEAGYGGFAAQGEAIEAESSSAPEVDPEKIIYSADATIETTEFDSTIAALSELIAQYDGFVESSSISTGNYYQKARGTASRNASYLIRIPSKHFFTLMGSLSTLGNVPYSHTYTENISAQYYDVQARLTAYKTQEARLLEMMAVAETVEDVILLEDRLSELRYNIENLQSTINNWDRQVSYSSISLQIEEVREYSPEPDITYGQELWMALKDAIRDFGQFLKDLLVFIVSSLPTLICLGVLAVIFIPIVKKRRAKRKAKKEEAQK